MTTTTKTYTTLKALKRLCAINSVALETCSAGYSFTGERRNAEIILDAPHGYYFPTIDAHGAVEVYADANERRIAIREAALHVLSMRRCNAYDCPVCDE